MGNASHRIEVLVLGVVLLLGAAFAAITAGDQPAAHTLRLALPPVSMPPQLLPAADIIDALPALPPEVPLALGGISAATLAARAIRRRARALARTLPLAGARITAEARRVIAAAWRHPNAAPQAVAPLLADTTSPERHTAQPQLSAPTHAAVTEAEAAPSPSTPLAADDLAASVAATLADAWQALGLQSAATALDVELGSRGSRATVAIEAAAADECALIELPRRLAAQAGWSARWRGGALEVRTPLALAAAPGPPLLPLLRHGRGGRVTRYAPLAWPHGRSGAHSRHLGIYGGHARELLHAGITALLLGQPPDSVAICAIAGDGERPYADLPHAVAPPGSPRAAIAMLDRLLRQGQAQPGARHLVLLVIEPDEALLADLARLVSQCRLWPDAPLSLVVAQERPLPAGRELYARLPGCVTGGGRGDATLLPGQPAWPARGAARTIATGGATAGAPATQDEAALSAALAELGRIQPRVLPPTLWDAPASGRCVGIAYTPQLSAPAASDPLATRLSRALDGIAEPAPAAQEAVEESLWPAGPGGVRPSEVEALITALLSDPSIIGATPPGVTKGRLAALLSPETRQHAGAILGWLDAAGALEAPRHEALRWREPRALRELPPLALAELLRALITPDPANRDQPEEAAIQ